MLLIRIRDPVPFWPLDQDPGWVESQHPDPGWTTRIIFLELRNHFFGVKKLKFFDADPGWRQFGSGIEKSRIRDKHPGSATLMVTKAPVPYIMYTTPSWSACQLRQLSFIAEFTTDIRKHHRVGKCGSRHPEPTPAAPTYPTPTSPTDPEAVYDMNGRSQMQWGKNLILSKEINANQCWGSVTFWCGSGSPDPYLWLMDPDPDSTSNPTPFFVEFQDGKFFCIYFFNLPTDIIFI